MKNKSQCKLVNKMKKLQNKKKKNKKIFII